MRFKTVLLLMTALALVVTPALAKDQMAKQSYPVTLQGDVRDTFEGFEGVFPPDGWTVVSNSGHMDIENWYQGSVSAYEGTYSAHCDYDPDLVPQDNEMYFSHTVLAGEDHLNFWIAGSAYWSINYDMTVEIDGTQVYSWAATYGDVSWVFEQHDIDLSAYVDQTVTVTFRYTGTDGAAIYLDAVSFNGGVVPPEPPVNDTCDGAIELPVGEFDFAGDLTLANNDYDPLSGGCTGYSAAGNDVAYVFTLGADQTFDVSVTGSHDGSIYVVTDCADAAGTCLVGADDTLSGQAEVLSYTNDTGAPITLYLIVDAYSGGADFTGFGTNGETTPAQESSWSSVKARY